MMTIPVSDVRRGDIIRFKSFALRVESEPHQAKGRVYLRGRISTDGCPLVNRSYLSDTTIRVERGA